MMIDLRTTIEPRSDQLNADDLIAGSKTITVRDVSLKKGEDQPVSIYFEGDNNKPFRPCKSMRRVLVKAWGPDGSKYIGKSMTLFCDPDVTFGGSKIGGIRISHVSDIERPFTMALTVTRAKRGQYSVQPLLAPSQPKIMPNLEQDARKAAARGMAALKTMFEALDSRQKRALLPIMPALKEDANAADALISSSSESDPFSDTDTEEDAAVRQRAYDTYRNTGSSAVPPDIKGDKRKVGAWRDGIEAAKKAEAQDDDGDA